MQRFDQERRAAGRGERRRPAQNRSSSAPVQDEPFPSPEGAGHGGESDRRIIIKNLPEASNTAKSEPECFIQVEECHLPGLGVALTLDHTKNESSDDGVSDLVCFVSGLLLGTNAKVRTWFGTFIRNGQQVG